MELLIVFCLFCQTVFWGVDAYRLRSLAAPADTSEQNVHCPASDTTNDMQRARERWQGTSDLSTREKPVDNVMQMTPLSGNRSVLECDVTTHP